jgi:DNA-binding beta-propeller fold protein YncE
MSSRGLRFARRCVLLLVALGGWAMLSSVPALALSQRAHSFTFSFGAAGAGDGQFDEPGSIAVDEGTGALYVSDTENSRLEQFAPEVGAGGEVTGYKFVSAWGWGVSNGKKEYEVCKSECEAGIKGPTFFKSPGQVAVDNSAGGNGDVYVVANHVEEKGLVYRFGPNGEPVSASSTKNRFGEVIRVAGAPLPAGAAPMAVGTVEEEVPVCKAKIALEKDACEAKCREEAASGKTGTCEWEWARNEEGTEELASELEAIEGVAVDSRGIVWVDGETEDVFSYGSDGQMLEYAPEVDAQELAPGLGYKPPSGSFPLRPGLAVASVVMGAKGGVEQDHLYFDYEPGGEEKEGKGKICSKHRCVTGEMNAFELAGNEAEGTESSEEGRVIAARLGGQASTGVAVDPVDGDAYVDNTTSVAVLDEDGSLIDRFDFPGLVGGGALAVDHAAGPEVGSVYVLEPASDRVDVFAPAPAGAPSVDSIGTPTVESEAAVIGAKIDPSGEKTTYVARYTAAACTGAPSACAGEAPIPAGTVTGFGDHEVSIALAGLAPSTTYHVRVIAKSAKGEAESEGRSFTTRASMVQSAMLDGRAWEMVSPVDKHGAAIYPLRQEGGLIQAASDGKSIAYIASGPVGSEPAGFKGPEPAEILATRNGSGWDSSEITTPNEAPAEGVHVGKMTEYRFFSPDLSSSLVAPIAHVKLSPEAPERVQGNGPWPYVRDDDPATCPPAPLTCYQSVVTAADDTSTATNEDGEPIGPLSAELEFEGASSDMSHIVLHSSVPLTSETSLEGELYMWSAGKLQLISLLEDGQPAAPGAHVGGAINSDEIKAAAVSTNGSRVVWAGEDPATQEDHLYMRELAHEGEPARTYQVDEGSPADARLPPNPRFQTASADGSKVFFTDQQSLTVSAGTAEKEEENLYVFEPEKPAGQRVTDLTPRTGPEENASVQGNVLGVSEDGTVVYFVANGIFGEGGQRGNCDAIEGSDSAGCNLYVVRYANGAWQAPHFIARLAQEDFPDWAGDPTDSLSRQTSRVSPNGAYLAFMSERSLTGYDNEDVSSHKAGERLDEEVYLYSEATGRLSCASCDPSGARPRGVLDEETSREAEPEGAGLLVDFPEIWQYSFVGTEEGEADHWLAGSVPGWTSPGVWKESAVFHQSAYLSDDGRLFFDSADALVPLKTPTKEELIGTEVTKVGVENVYEYEPQGVGSCDSEDTQGGCVALISSGESEHESAFVEASENGDDVFFITAAKLVASDTDTAYDLYDARVCTAAEPCNTASTGASTQSCSGENEERCRSATATPSFAAPTSQTPGSGNVVARGEALAAKAVQKAKPLTRAQKLARALKLCKKDKKKTRRLACERTARKDYGPKTAKKSEKKKS